jgi:hypothetical protein
MIGFWLALVLFLLFLASGPWWPYSRGWGAAPAAVILTALLLWLLLGWFGWVAISWPGAASPAPSAT